MSRMPKAVLVPVLLAVPCLSGRAEPKAGAAPGNAAAAPEKEPPAVDQAAIDAAIAKGAEWLRGQLKAGLPPINEADDALHSGQTYNEIVLYTLIHAGVDRGDPDLIKLVNEIRGKPPCHTYTGALRAMAFEMYDPVKLRAELAMTAQFLIDNQGHNGQWGYSRPIPWPPLPNVIFTATSAPPRYITTGPQGGPAPTAPAAPAAGDAKAGDPVRRWPDGTPMNKSTGTDIKKAPPKQGLTRRGWGSPNDNSNTQYAILGLSACMAEGLMAPPDCWGVTEKLLTDKQNDDGGWGYDSDGRKDSSTGSMSAGGLSSLAACIRGLKNSDPRQDPRVQKGLQWMAKNMVFNRNPESFKWHYYWIYGVERAGSLAGTEWFGDRAWYSEGAQWLLGAQQGDGTWGGRSKKPQWEKGEKILDTCWAILFLRRATKHIVQKRAAIATGG